MADRSVLRIVSDLTSSRTTVVDLNNGSPMYLGSEERDWGTDDLLRRAEAENALGDGGVVMWSVLGLRTITLPIRVVAANRAAAFAAAQPLIRALDRSASVLEWQPEGIAAPVFFRLFRSTSMDIDDPMDGSGSLLLTLTLRAEPPAYGMRVDLPLATVTNDPAAATNPMYLDVAGVLGDLDTPAFLRIQSTQVGPPQSYVVATRRRGTPPAGLAQQAETATMGVNTAVAAANDPAMSGTGNNYARTTFANATMDYRVQFGLGTTPNRGAYRVLVRHRRSVAGDTIKGHLMADSTPLDTVTHPAGVTGPYWVDYGIITVPRGLDPVTRGFDGVEYVANAIDLTLYLARTAGTGTADTDVLQLVPADCDYGVFDTSAASNVSVATNTGAIVLDGPRDAEYVVAAAAIPPAALHWLGKVKRVGGGLPMLSPGVTNRIYVIDTTAGGAPSVTERVLVSYWPRFLQVAQ